MEPITLKQSECYMLFVDIGEGITTEYFHHDNEIYFPIGRGFLNAKGLAKANGLNSVFETLKDSDKESDQDHDLNLAIRDAERIGRVDNKLDIPIISLDSLINLTRYNYVPNYALKGIIGVLASISKSASNELAIAEREITQRDILLQEKEKQGINTNSILETKRHPAMQLHNESQNGMKSL